MHLPGLVVVVTSLLACICTAASQLGEAADVILQLNQQALEALKQREANQQKRDDSCYLDSANVRSDWYVFPIHSVTLDSSIF